MSVRAMTTFKSNDNVMVRVCHSGYAEIYEYGDDLKKWIGEFEGSQGCNDQQYIGGLAAFVIHRMYEEGYRAPYVVYYGHDCLDMEYEVNMIRGKLNIKIFSLVHNAAPQKNTRFLMYDGPVDMFDPFNCDPYRGYE